MNTTLNAQAIVYEQPLNERIRNLLRLEHLFEAVSNNIEKPSAWDSRAAIIGLLEINDLLSRADIKAELIKEMERHVKKLASYQRIQGVDTDRLGETLESLNAILNALRENGYEPGQALRKDELIVAVKQRLSIPGGTCGFDLPGYHRWLNLATSERQEQLKQWSGDLEPLRVGIDLTLRLIRESATPMEATAKDGFLQVDLDSNTPCQLIRIVLSPDSRFFPEISGGRHRVTIRFMAQTSTTSRPSQTNHDVRFDLQRCLI